MCIVLCICVAVVMCECVCVHASFVVHSIKMLYLSLCMCVCGVCLYVCAHLCAFVCMCVGLRYAAAIGEEDTPYTCRENET